MSDPVTSRAYEYASIADRLASADKECVDIVTRLKSIRKDSENLFDHAIQLWDAMSPAEQEEARRLLSARES